MRKLIPLLLLVACTDRAANRADCKTNTLPYAKTAQDTLNVALNCEQVVRAREKRESDRALMLSAAINSSAAASSRR